MSSSTSSENEQVVEEHSAPAMAAPALERVSPSDIIDNPADTIDIPTEDIADVTQTIPVQKEPIVEPFDISAQTQDRPVEY